jgi:hypothetical protein
MNQGLCPVRTPRPGTAIALLEVVSHRAGRTAMAFMIEGAWDRVLRTLAGS